MAEVYDDPAGKTDGQARAQLYNYKEIRCLYTEIV
jgi:hypothetical protein